MAPCPPIAPPPQRISEELPQLLDAYFAADGAFMGRMPDDFFRFSDAADQRGDIHNEGINTAGLVDKKTEDSAKIDAVNFFLKGSPVSANHLALV
jgi:hypothetical protein